MKTNKKFLSLILAIVLVLPILFVGCQFGAKEFKLKDGTYEVTTYAVDGASNNELIGLTVTINNRTFTDWDGNVETYTIADKQITLNWRDVVFTGTVTERSIFLNSTIDGHEYVLVLNHVEKVNLQNGEYRITTYAVDGVSNSEIIGESVMIDNGTLTDWAQHVATYEIKGDMITFNWDGRLITGNVTETVISINTTINGQTFVMILVKM